MKCIEKFHDKFELKMALPDWQHRGHAVFPEGIHTLLGYQFMFQSRYTNTVKC